MNCNIVKDLIPLYIDRCCSPESERAVEEHIRTCNGCQKLWEDMKIPSATPVEPNAPKRFRKLNDWKASVLQSVLLLLSFALLTVGVALEARTPTGSCNGFWALNLVVPATGFLLSLTNWYFVRVYRSKNRFSNCYLLATLVITVSAYIWSGFHYEIHIATVDHLELLRLNGIGILLTAVFCTLSKLLSAQYAAMLGKE